MSFKTVGFFVTSVNFVISVPKLNNLVYLRNGQLNYVENEKCSFLFGKCNLWYEIKKNPKMPYPGGNPQYFL
jgi:hypothetical protein